jgi:hypothetical protein
MLNKKFISTLFFLPFILSGCGDIEIPTSIENTESFSPIPTLNLDNLSISPTPEVALKCEDIKKEKENLEEAVVISQEELKTCKLEKNQLESISSSSQISSTQIQEVSPLLKKFLSDVKQEEYKFDSCGRLESIRNSSWYSSFKSSLTTKSILFKSLNRPLQDNDFYSVCVSNEGKVALFLGANNDGKDEFHMIKYNFESNILQESILLNGSCQNCPTKFGKRFGSYITLNGFSGNNRKGYKFYYDSNLIIED